MTQQEALRFMEPAVAPGAYTWVDLGAGSGVFSRALAERLGPQGQVFAIDRSSEVLRIKTPSGGALIQPYQLDFTYKLDLPSLDGLLMANALHFVEQQAELLGQLLTHLKPSGTFVLIEYDHIRPNPWVPYPVSLQTFRHLAQALGLSEPVETYRQASRYGQGMIYGAMARVE